LRRSLEHKTDINAVEKLELTARIALAVRPRRLALTWRTFVVIATGP